MSAADFVSDPFRKGLWTSFLKAKKITMSLGFDQVMMGIRAFLSPVVETLKFESKFNCIWDQVRQVWKGSI